MKSVLENNRLVFIIETDLIAGKVKELVEETKDAFVNSDQYLELVLELSKTKIIDSIGITFVIGLYKTAINLGKKFKVTGVNRDIGELFKLIKLDEVFEVELA